MFFYDHWKLTLSSSLVLLLLLLAATLTQWTNLESSVATQDVGLYEYNIEFKGSASGRDGKYKLSCDFVSNYDCSFLRSAQQAMVFSLGLTFLQTLLFAFCPEKPSGAYQASLVATSTFNMLCMVVMLIMYPLFSEAAFSEQDDTDYSTNHLGACFYLVVSSLVIHLLFGLGLLVIDIMGWREGLFGVPFHEMDHYKFSTDKNAKNPVSDDDDEHDDRPLSSPYTQFGDKKAVNTTNSNTAQGNVHFQDDLDEALHESAPRESKEEGGLGWDSGNNGGYHVATRLSDDASRLGQPLGQG